MGTHSWLVHSCCTQGLINRISTGLQLWFCGFPMKCTAVLVGVLRTTHSTNQPWPTIPSGCHTHLSHQWGRLGRGEFPGLRKGSQKRCVWHDTWGEPPSGGDCSAVQDQLKNVQQIQATSSSFAAILANGSIVTWADPRCGGDCSAVQYQLKNVQQIQATDLAFAAILANGSVVTWGDPHRGGDCSAVQDQLKNVQLVQATSEAFAAINWPMDPSLPGVIHTTVVTALQFKIISRMRNKFKPLIGHLLRSWPMDPSLPGWSTPWWWLLCSSGSAQERATNSSHELCICCHLGQWIRRYLGWSTLWWWLLCSSGSASVFVEDDFRSLSLK